MTILLALALALNTTATAATVKVDNVGDQVVACLQLVFSVYLLALSARALVTNDGRTHATYVWHIAPLAIAAALALCLVSTIPGTPVFGTVLHAGGFLKNSWYGLSAIYAVVGVLASTTPTGPPLHFPLDHIYADNTVKAISNTNPKNVCGVTSENSFLSPLQLCADESPGASPWGTLLLSYTNVVVNLANRAASLEIGDLPVLSGSMRATYNYAHMRDAMRKMRHGLFGSDLRPGSGWKLLLDLLDVNRLALIGAVALSLVSALAYYGPAFFLRKLIAYLEADPGRENPRWGWVYVIALLCSTWFTNLGELWEPS